MDNVGFQPSGEEIERALMDLGPLLGVSIKEEAPEELPDAADARPNDGGPSVGAGGEAAGDSPLKEGDGVDSLASPNSSLAATRCIFCNLPLSQTEGVPKLMECLHSTCEPCIKTKIEEKQSNSRDFLGAERITITCSACRLQCQPANMIDQRFVLEKINLEPNGANCVSGERECSSCDDPEPASSYCVDCGEFICDSCVQAHRRLKITKDHTIKSKEEAVAELQAAQGGARQAHDMFCSEHPQERLSLFCSTCDRLTCRDCQLQHHRDHKHHFSSEMALHARSSIAALLAEVSYKRVLLGSAMKVIKDRQALIADKKKALVREITQTVVKLTEAINTRGKQLVLRLNELCDGKQRTLTEKRAALQQLAAITDHTVLFVQQALQQGSDTAVLHSKRSVCAHLQRIKSRRADIPNPDVPVRITLALDQLPALLHVLSTIGGIVVDGKMDGGPAGAGAGAGGGAQGPYHPPQATPPPPAQAPPPAPPHSAVVALQQVAMQQSFVQSRGSPGAGAGGGGSQGGGGGGSGLGGAGLGGGGAGLGGGALAALQQQMRALRHPHVTSTTHPHHLQGMSELNLRGLLNQGGGRGMRGAAPAPQPQPQHLAMQHAYQQMMGAYASSAYHQHAAAAAAGGAAGGRRGAPRTPSPAPPPHYAAPPPAAKWHIPQHYNSNGSFDMNSASVGAASSDFKITLGRAPRPPPAPAPAPAPAPPAPAAVTSTNPKTPSPSLNGSSACELDKVMAESVQDLMATIAKLDSNGVQVLPERPPPSPAPTVSSSTSHGKSPAATSAAPAAGGGGGDPNEDWCAVCMDGGELMCCDKCPKVFHQYCHIPTIDKLPDETESWQCLLCVNFADLPEEAAGAAGAAGGGEGLSARQQKVVERITLELYCQYEASLAFREPVPAINLHYHSKIPSPMCLDAVRTRLQPRAAARYRRVPQFVADCRLIFHNAYIYNAPDSQIYKDAQRLEAFFDSQLQKWLPEYATWGPEGGVPGPEGGAPGPPPPLAGPPAGAPHDDEPSAHKRPRVDMVP